MKKRYAEAVKAQKVTDRPLLDEEKTADKVSVASGVSVPGALQLLRVSDRPSMNSYAPTPRSSLRKVSMEMARNPDYVAVEETCNWQESIELQPSKGLREATDVEAPTQGGDEQRSRMQEIL